MQRAAVVARFHCGALPTRRHKLLRDLFPDEQKATIQLAAILRLANAMDAAHDGHIRRIHIEMFRSKGNRTKLWRSPPKGIRPWDHLLKPSPPSAICWRPCFTARCDQADEESLDPKPSSDRVWAGTTPPCRPVGSKRLRSSTTRGRKKNAP